MNLRNVFFAMLLAAGLVGCGKQAQPRHIVILIDVSGSIDRQSLGQAFKAIDELVGHLHRGDRIAIIPILGDAEAEASGRIIRFEVPISRQSYDSDLRRFRLRLGISLKEMQSNALAHPGSKTDILGSVALAGQEFEVSPRQLNRELVILTDFIQENREVDFRKDQRLINRAAAGQFAMKMAEAKQMTFQGVQIYLGMMRSTEYSGLSQMRRDAIQRFWIEYFKSCFGQPKFLTDGTGLVATMPS